MKHCMVVYTALSILLALVKVEVVLADEGVKTISVVQTEESPVIDGSLDDECWA